MSQGWREWLATVIGTMLIGVVWRLKNTRKVVFMSEKEILQTPIGPEAKVNLKVVDGNIVVEVQYNGADGFGSLAVGVKPDAFIDKLKAAIPGTLDDMIFDALKGALK